MARRFRFRLGQVLNLRKQVEELRIRELAQAQGELLKIEQSLRAHAEEERAFLERYGNFEKTGAFNADDVMAYCQYKDWLLRREKELHRREQEWMKEAERRRQAVVKASREKRLLENLKKRQFREHAREVLGEEQRFLDEISSIAFVRRARALQIADVHENLGR
jgi:flagellar protein FliJ